MSNVAIELEKRGLIHPPTWMGTNIHYLTIMGSVAYGVSSDTSDMDIYGFCTPRKETVFPHLAGKIIGFDEIEEFNQWQQHHVDDPSALGGKGRVYDFSIYNIVRYFYLLKDNNPNMIDSIYTPQECVLHATAVANMVRENRNIFLHKGCYPKLKGYAYSQLHKMTGKKPIGKRKKQREKFGFDVKFAYHLIRLLNECEQILIYGTLDLRQNNEQLKAIRRGEVTEKEVMKMAAAKEKQLEELYAKTTLPDKPQDAKIKQLLIDCLEHHYGNLEKAIIIPDKHTEVLRDIRAMLDKAGI